MSFSKFFIRSCKQLLLVDAIRTSVSMFRYFILVNLLRRLKVYQGNKKDLTDIAITHNLGTVQKNSFDFKHFSVSRSHKLIRPLSSINSIYQRVDSLDLLTIGPRTEGEILNLVGYGFSLSKVRGLDLFSYSPWVDVGDMHEMPYKDNSFDAIVNGWVINYSENRKKAAEEMIRVVRNGGIIAVGVTSQKPTFSKNEDKVGSVNDILDLFNNHVDRVFFSQDYDPKNDQIQDLLVVFSVKK